MDGWTWSDCMRSVWKRHAAVNNTGQCESLLLWFRFVSRSRSKRSRMTWVSDWQLQVAVFLTRVGNSASWPQQQHRQMNSWDLLNCQQSVMWNRRNQHLDAQVSFSLWTIASLTVRSSQGWFLLPDLTGVLTNVKAAENEKGSEICNCGRRKWLNAAEKLGVKFSGSAMQTVSPDWIHFLKSIC